MPISRRPKDDSPPPAAVDVDALILKGGSVAGQGAAGREVPRPQPTTPAKDPMPVVLRVPAALLGRIDEALDARAVKIPRHTWLLEAVVEKLERESGGAG